MWTRRCSILLAVAWLAGACDSQSDSAAKPAKAEAKKPAEDPAIAERRAEREQQAREQKEAEQQKEAQLDALAVLPDEVPKSLDKACAQMLEAYDGYMQSVLEGDMLTKWKTGGNEMQLAVFRKECLKRSAKVAACQANALKQAPPELESSLADIMQRCADKFGSDNG